MWKKRRMGRMRMRMTAEPDKITGEGDLEPRPATAVSKAR
jgi:hypothetical protein